MSENGSSSDLQWPPSPTTEHRRALEPGWSEIHRLLCADSDGRSALALQVEIQKAAQNSGNDIASFLCAYFRLGELPIALLDHEIQAPAERWEFRTSGLWADMICEEPYIHWSYGLEAFGLAVDEPEELLGRGYGQRMPLGWELDFESTPDRLAPLADPEGYGQPGTIDGIVLLAGGTETLSGPAVRQHWWGQNQSADLGGPDRHARQLAAVEPGDAAVPTFTEVRPPAANTSEVALPVAGAVWRLIHGPQGLWGNTEPT